MNGLLIQPVLIQFLSVTQSEEGGHKVARFPSAEDDQENERLRTHFLPIEAACESDAAGLAIFTVSTRGLLQAPLTRSMLAADTRQ